MRTLPISGNSPSANPRLLTEWLRRPAAGISQRDPNYYDFWNERETQEKVVNAVTTFWENHIKGKWEQTQGDCACSPVCSPLSSSLRLFPCPFVLNR